MPNKNVHQHMRMQEQRKEEKEIRELQTSLQRLTQPSGIGYSLFSSFPKLYVGDPDGLCAGNPSVGYGFLFGVLGFDPGTTGFRPCTTGFNPPILFFDGATLGFVTGF